MNHKAWCPNCEFFYKDLGLNYCRLANWAFYPLNGGDPAVLAWLTFNQPDDSTRIRPDADDCPGFIPYTNTLASPRFLTEGELAQLRAGWAEQWWRWPR